MRLVVDTNILFSILIGGRKLRQLFLIMRESVEFQVPAAIIEEVEKLLPKAARYVGTSPELIYEIFRILIKPYLIVRDEREIPDQVREKAKELVRDVDPDDWPFVGLAMFLGVPLWTGDKELLRLSVETGFKYFVAVDTEGVEMLLEGKKIEEVEEGMRERYWESVI
ncbi:MAG: PIN domain-containing protein [Desulfurococcales archaeon]|nr:PIN domain-containing protein [Desulfurococcales archaeon]